MKKYLLIALMAVALSATAQQTPTNKIRANSDFSQVDNYLIGLKRLGIPTSETDNLDASGLPQNTVKLIYNTTLQKLRVYNPVTGIWSDALPTDLTNFVDLNTTQTIGGTKTFNGQSVEFANLNPVKFSSGINFPYGSGINFKDASGVYDFSLSSPGIGPLLWMHVGSEAFSFSDDGNISLWNGGGKFLRDKDFDAIVNPYLAKYLPSTGGDLSGSLTIRQSGKDVVFLGSDGTDEQGMHIYSLDASANGYTRYSKNRIVYNNGEGSGQSIFSRPTVNLEGNLVGNNTSVANPGNFWTESVTTPTINMGGNDGGNKISSISNNVVITSTDGLQIKTPSNVAIAELGESYNKFHGAVVADNSTSGPYNYFESQDNVTGINGTYRSNSWGYSTGTGFFNFLVPEFDGGHTINFRVSPFNNDYAAYISDLDNYLPKTGGSITGGLYLPNLNDGQNDNYKFLIVNSEPGNPVVKFVDKEHSPFLLNNPVTPQPGSSLYLGDYNNSMRFTGVGLSFMQNGDTETGYIRSGGGGTWTINGGNTKFLFGGVEALGISDRIYVSSLIQTNHDIEITDATKGIILKSPSGVLYRVTINDAGDFVKTAL